MGVRDCRRINARSRLELPKRFAGFLVKREEFSRHLASENKSASRGQHARCTRKFGQRNLPFLFAGYGINRQEVAENVVRLHIRLLGLDTGGGPSNDLRLGLRG